MKKANTFTKTTATVLATLTVLFSSCVGAFAAEQPGGAEVYTGNEVRHYESIAQAWETAASSKKEAKIVLHEDWIADEDGSFGEGKAFRNGAIYLSEQTAGLTLDLNGFSIDRELEEEQKDGAVFRVERSKKFVVTDSSADGSGSVSGGFNEGNGGAFSVLGSEVKIENICLEDNQSAAKGGAISIEGFADGDLQYQSKVTLDNCQLRANTASKGGAVYLDASNSLQVFDTTVTKNSAENDGGICTEVCGLSKAKITLGGKVVIADNEAANSGKGLTLGENFFTKVIVSYDKNRPLSEESEIVVLSKTSDRTLRITADSSETHIGCFTYENGKYEIIAKGSGDGKYLDIKKK